MPTQDRVRSLQDELKRQEIVIDEIFAEADKTGRDPTDAEKAMYNNAVSRMEATQPEIDFHVRALEVTSASAAKAAELDRAMSRRAVVESPSGLPEYRSAGNTFSMRRLLIQLPEVARRSPAMMTPSA